VKTGRIKWFNSMVQHGFIVLGDGQEVYFHTTGVKNPTQLDLFYPGTDVCFDLIETRAGAEAHNVEAI